MEELINGRTPEEIKHWMRCCSAIASCYNCPYNRNDYCVSEAVLPNALSYIQHLEAQQPKWISVRDQIPELDRLVVFGYSDKQFIYIGYLSSDELKWMGYDDNRVARPSHWMPLPEPPKEE